MEVISSETGIALGVVVVLIGAVLWLAKIQSMAAQSKGEIVGLQKRIDTLEIESNDVADRMARIETKLDFLIENLKEK